MDGEMLKEKAVALSKIFFDEDEQRSLERLEYNFNGRLTTTAGRCKYIKISGRFIPFMIEISKKYIAEFPEMLDNILLHEMIHAVLPHGTYHGKTFLKKADQLMAISREKGREIEITASIPEKMQIEKAYKHLYQCADCQNTYKRARKPIDTRKYVCGKCHGRLAKVKAKDE